MENKSKLFLFGSLLLFLLIPLISAEVGIGITAGKPQIISVGQNVTPGEITLFIGIKNIGNSKGGFRLFIEPEKRFRLKEDWYGTLDAGEIKNLQLKLIGDPKYYGEINYKIILEETLSKEKNVYSESALISQKMVAEEGTIPSSENQQIKINILSKSKIFYGIGLLIIIIGIVIYFKVLKSKRK